MTKVELFKATYALLKDVQSGTASPDEAMNFILANYSSRVQVQEALQKGA